MSPPESIRNILILRVGAIGDFILTLPAISALRRKFPEARLALMGYAHIARLALAGGLVDEVRQIVPRSLAPCFMQNQRFPPRELTEHFSPFDLIVSYLHDPKNILEANLKRWTRAEFVACPNVPDGREKNHCSKLYLKPLERLGIMDADPVPRLSMGLENPIHCSGRCQEAQIPSIAAPEDSMARTIAIHPGSSSERKNWPEARWAELLRHISERTNFNLLLAGGAAEHERVRRLAAALPAPRSRVAQSLPLTELAGLLERCAGFIGHDSGITHLAAAVGLPGLVLWSDAAEDIWRPPSEKMLLARHPAGLAELAVAQVIERFNELLVIGPIGPIYDKTLV